MKQVIPFMLLVTIVLKGSMTVGQFRPGYKPPTQYQLRESLLKREVEKLKKDLKRKRKNGRKKMFHNDQHMDGSKERSIMN